MSDVPSNLPFDPLDEVDAATPPSLGSDVVPPAAPRSLASDVAAPSAPVPSPTAPVPPPVAPPSPAVPLAPRPTPPPTPQPAPSAPSAPAAGALDMFADVQVAPPIKTSTAPTPAPSAMPPLPPPHETHKTALIGGIVAVVFFILAGGGWYGYKVWQERAEMAPPSLQDIAPVPTTELPILPPPAQEPTPTELFGNEVVPPSGEYVPLPPPVTTPPTGVTVPDPVPVNPDAPVMPTAPITGVNDSVLGENPVGTSPQAPVVEFDMDGDGLSDARERELGTDPAKADTDGDTLNDGAEVTAYGTNPLDVDTDKDGFPDGVEIGNGFNPRGTGRCADPSCRL